MTKVEPYLNRGIPKIANCRLGAEETRDGDESSEDDESVKWHEDCDLNQEGLKCKEKGELERAPPCGRSERDLEVYFDTESEDSR